MRTINDTCRWGGQLISVRTAARPSTGLVGYCGRNRRFISRCIHVEQSLNQLDVTHRSAYPPLQPPARSAAPECDPAHANSAGRSCFCCQYGKQRAQMAHIEAGLDHQASASRQPHLDSLGNGCESLLIDSCHFHRNELRGLRLANALLPVVELPITSTRNRAAVIAIHGEAVCRGFCPTG